MKKYSILKYLLVLSFIFSLQSCVEEIDKDFDTSSKNNLSWQSKTYLNFSPVSNKAFIRKIDAFNVANQVWKNTNVDLNVTLVSNLLLENFSKIDFYVTAQEQDGYNFTPPFDTTSKLLTSVTTIPANGKFVLSLDVTTLYELFKTKFVKPHPYNTLIPGDLFEVHYIITNKDGSTLNSTNFVDGKYRFGVTTKVEWFTTLGWVGTFNTQWVEATPQAISYGKIFIGKTGTQVFNLDDFNVNTLVGLSSTNNIMFGYYYGLAGNINYNYNTGETTVIDTKNNGTKWKIKNVNGPSLDIELIYKYSAGYNEYATVRVTRTDGTNWNPNIFVK